MDQEISLIAPLNLEEEFMKIMRDERLCRAFREFMKESHSNENLTFW